MIDTSSLFLHVLAAMGIVSGGVVQVLAGVRLRASAVPSAIGTWARFARAAGPLIVGSSVVSLLTGGHLAGAVWTTESTSGFARPFITLGLAGLLLLVPVGPMLGGPRLRRLAHAADVAQPDEGPSELLADARSPKLWGPVHALVGVSVGMVALMVYKPGWVVGAVLLVATFAAGWAVGAAVSQRTASG